MHNISTLLNSLSLSPLLCKFDNIIKTPPLFTMDTFIQVIDKLIQQADFFTWEKSSHHVYGDGHDIQFGNELSGEWKSWVKRIEHVLKKTVKPDSAPYIHFNTADSIVIPGNFEDKFNTAKSGYIGALTTLKDLIETGDPFDELLSNEFESTEQPKETKTFENMNLSNKKVFIVHGHDHALKIELEVFLSHIGLKPIVLHREADSGKTIIEKFEANSDVVYAFILLTPDEIGYTVDQEKLADADRKKEHRARPNVIFEFGYFVAKLGRGRVCALHKGNVSIPSDLSGFIYKKVDSSIEEIGFSLIKELKAAGLSPEL